MLNERNIRWFFPVGSDFVITKLRELVAKYPHMLDQDNGWSYCLVVDQTNGRPLDYSAEESLKLDTDGSARLRVHFVDGLPLPGRAPAVKFRLDIPFAFLKKPAQYADGMYHMYQVRFCVPEDETKLTAEAVAPLFAGYVGITKRHPIARLKEHVADVRSGGGYLLHSVWRSLAAAKVRMYPVFQWAGVADTLKKIYAMEEQAVARYSLTPKGLNAIPGGEAGIRMLHKLSLLKGRKLPGVAERDAALAMLEKQAGKHGSPCTHYRTGHLRKLAADKLTWVSPCWVNLKEAA